MRTLAIASLLLAAFFSPALSEEAPVLAERVSAGKLPQDTPHERLSGHGQRCLGPHEGQRPQACGQACRQDERRNHDTRV